MGTLLNLDQRLTQYNKFDFMTGGGQIWGVGGEGERVCRFRYFKTVCFIVKKY